jgi:EAL domain-containing protein (putative c-di-GMP-specific phosphodiesterase class I)
MLVSAADDADLLTELEEHVLDIACRDIKTLRTDPALRDLAVHVNLSATRAGDPQLVRTVREALVRHSLPGQALVLEITETSRVPDLDTAAWVLNQIRRLDVRLALDDFGTGYSGLSYLLELPIDIVKLDRSLTVADADSRGGTIRRAAAALTMGLGLDLIAEGVETVRQAEEVAGLGCQFGQGFLWARPAFLPELDLSGKPAPELIHD